MLKDFSDSIKATLYERATSPLFGVFVLSWFAFNWKIPVIIFVGKGDIFSRLRYVEDNLLIKSDFLFFYPLYVTLLILVFYPALAVIPFFWWQFWGNIRNKIRQNIEGKSLLTLEQSNQLRIKIAESEADKHRLLNQKEEENIALRNQIDVFVKKENDYQKMNLSNESSIKNLEIDNTNLRKELSELHNILSSINSENYLNKNESNREKSENNLKINITQPEKIIDVHTPKEFIDAIGSNRIINIASNELQLDELKNYKPSEKVNWTISNDGEDITIFDVRNLHITSKRKVPSRILVSPLYSYVLTIKKSSFINFTNLEIGHVPKGHCTGGVVKIIECNNFHLQDSVLFGCGTEGVTVENSADILIDNSEITDCTYSIFSVNNSKRILFKNSKFSRNKEFDLINVKNKSDVIFESCDISGNQSGLRETSEYCLFSVDRSSSVILKNSRVLRNQVTFFVENEGTVLFQNTLVEANDFKKLYKSKLFDNENFVYQAVQPDLLNSPVNQSAGSHRT